MVVDFHFPPFHSFILTIGVYMLCAYIYIYMYIYSFDWFLFFSSQYLTELLTERQKLGPFVQVLPICSRLLNQGLAFS